MPAFSLLILGSFAYILVQGGIGAYQLLAMQTLAVYGISNNVRVAWLEITASEADSLHHKKFLKELVDYTSNRYEFRTRVRATEALERLNYCDEELIINLFNACTYTNNRLSNPASKCLKSLLKKPEYLQMAKTFFEACSWREWERRVIEPLLK